ncbi:hypothetical protein ACS0TY_023178 [Phlomoides rotata]
MCIMPWLQSFQMLNKTVEQRSPDGGEGRGGGGVYIINTISNKLGLCHSQNSETHNSEIRISLVLSLFLIRDGGNLPQPPPPSPPTAPIATDRPRPPSKATDRTLQKLSTPSTLSHISFNSHTITLKFIYRDVYRTVCSIFFSVTIVIATPGIFGELGSD